MRGAVVAIVVASAAMLALHAFPPALHQEVFGTIRDERGNPFSLAGAEVLMDIGGATVAKASVTPTPVNGANYQLIIPLDTGSTGDKYHPSALFPAVGFRLKVRAGVATYLPMEMTGAASLMTRAGAVARTDLTLGVDSDGDGLPDAWERDLMAAMGWRKALSEIRPGDDADGDGLSNLNEYLAGTYAFDPADGFTMTIKGTKDGGAGLEFTAVRGRTYIVQGSADFKTWSSLPFVLQTDPAGASPRKNFSVGSGRTRLVRIWTRPSAADAPATGGETSYKF
ncbi:MAG: hypothetical protein EBZ67_13090, partial [Chitinophagia bacterium]|nr:hypothetical protein [Chitinophagia bacterium]